MCIGYRVKECFARPLFNKKTITFLGVSPDKKKVFQQYAIITFLVFDITLELFEQVVLFWTNLFIHGIIKRNHAFWGDA